MTEPTPTRAPDAVPEAVLQAFGAWRRAMHAFSENDTDANLGDVRRAGREAHIAVATALREATETRDQEIARLTAELAAAQADTARLREFAAYIIRDECWGAGNRDGGTVQDEAARLGILRRVEMPAPCGEGCGCLENGRDFPAWCYRFAWTLDAARAAGEHEG